MFLRLMNITDIESVAKIHQSVFPRQQHSFEWIKCNYNASPRILNFVAIIDDEIVGYITWIQKSGFRPQVVLELEQLAVKPSWQGQGAGRNIITGSLVIIKRFLAKNGSTLKHILVTTRSDNFAQNLYRETLGAEIEAEISNLYSDDEVLMIARNVNNLNFG
ncbi:GNAT family N-acetyltransferase [Psychromonas algicola]|uniref:GNAT family N-acetyltransferase n=1 Tax=Psychromonas algicola TaxID=2555642 RepID=UPI001068867E|nr:GNAT family N-acetyltransferase [Psychromonas sp. RZ5]TEW51444.1 GNAT family N-acetyltransferase [Psychromonas sp. RZ5]